MLFGDNAFFNVFTHYIIFVLQPEAIKLRVKSKFLQNKYDLRLISCTFWIHMTATVLGICFGNRSQNINFIASVMTNGFILLTLRMT